MSLATDISSGILETDSEMTFGNEEIQTATQVTSKQKTSSKISNFNKVAKMEEEIFQVSATQTDWETKPKIKERVKVMSKSETHISNIKFENLHEELPQQRETVEGIGEHKDSKTGMAEETTNLSTQQANMVTQTSHRVREGVKKESHTETLISNIKIENQHKDVPQPPETVEGTPLTKNTNSNTFTAMDKGEENVSTQEIDTVSETLKKNMEGVKVKSHTNTFISNTKPEKLQYKASEPGETFPDASDTKQESKLKITKSKTSSKSQIPNTNIKTGMEKKEIETQEAHETKSNMQIGQGDKGIHDTKREPKIKLRHQQTFEHHNPDPTFIQQSENLKRPETIATDDSLEHLIFGHDSEGESSQERLKLTSNSQQQQENLKLSETSKPKSKEKETFSQTSILQNPDKYSTVSLRDGKNILFNKETQNKMFFDDVKTSRDIVAMSESVSTQSPDDQKASPIDSDEDFVQITEVTDSNESIKQTTDNTQKHLETDEEDSYNTRKHIKTQKHRTIEVPKLCFKTICPATVKNCLENPNSKNFNLRKM